MMSGYFSNGSTTQSCAYEFVVIKEKVRCYFLAFVMFLLAHKGILPLVRREINMREVPFGFG